MIAMILSALAGLDVGMLAGWLSTRVFGRTSREDLFCGTASEPSLKSASLLDDRLDRQMLAVPFHYHLISKRVWRLVRFITSHRFVENWTTVAAYKGVKNKTNRTSSISTEVSLLA